MCQTFMTRHIWMTENERLARTENMFVTPMYNSLMIQQSLSFNRKMEDEQAEIKTDDLNLDAKEEQTVTSVSINTLILRKKKL